jgi:prolyl oligopeptidase
MTIRLSALTLCLLVSPAAAKPSAPRYPATRTVDVVDEYHGTKVADPYRWLEDTANEEVRAWVEAQNRVTRAFLDAIPARAAFRRHLEGLWNYERYGVPYRRGRRWFITKNDGLQNQAVHYVMDRLDGPMRVLIDPNGFSKDGTVALSGTSPTFDGRYMAYGVSEAGSDWVTWKVRDVATGKDLPDIVRWVKFSGASWTRDGKGFFYCRYDEPKTQEAFTGANYFQKVFYHRLGAPQSEDRLVAEDRENKDVMFGAGVSWDGRYLVIGMSHAADDNSAMSYVDLKDPEWKVVPLLDRYDAQYGFIGNDGPVFYVQTDKDAPRQKVVAIDIRRPQPGNWRTVVPEASDALQSVEFIGGRFVCHYSRDAHSVLVVVSKDGKSRREVDLPTVGSVGAISGRPDDREWFYSFSGFITPPTTYRSNIATLKTTLYRKAGVKFDPDRFESRLAFCVSKDGTRVPMFVTHRKGLKLDGSNPVIVNGYGGFRGTMSPYFSIVNATWMELGGVFVTVGLRGGAEYGEEWHRAGMLKNKQNVFDDFIAAAEWLIAQGYTSSPKLAIEGGSNGGLLVGAVLTQRPELFGAAIPAVGVMDMLRYQKFTIGWAWAPEYGTSDDPEMFPVLRAYSPYHNIKPGTKYPATLVTTAETDDRVVPLHSYKFAAALQAAQGGTAPVLLRVETRSGHGGGKPVSKVLDEVADRMAFLVDALGVAPPDGGWEGW